MYLVIHRSMSVGTILPSGWNALHTLFEGSRIIAKTLPLTRSFLFLTRGHRNCSFVAILFHFAPVAQPRRIRPDSPSHTSHNLNKVFYSTSYHFPTMILWHLFLNFMLPSPLCCVFAFFSITNSFYTVFTNQTLHPFSSALQPFPSLKCCRI